MALVAEYVPGDSILHRLRPLAKLAWMLTLAVFCVIFGTPGPLFGIFLLVLALGLLGGVQRNLLAFLRGFTWVALTIFLVQLFFFRGGRVYFHLVPGLAWTAVTAAGVRFGLAMVLRTLAMTSLVPLLLCTTELKDLVVALVEKLRFPARFALMLVTILRFIPTFLGELDQITLAQRARGYRNDGRWPWQKWRGLLPVMIPLVHNALLRAEDLAVAMQQRGYAGGRRTFLRAVEAGPLDRIAVGLACVALCGGVAARVFLSC